MTSNEERNKHYETIHERYEGYALYDYDGERIGEPEDIFVDDDGQVEYIGVKLGSHGSAPTLIPSEVTRYDEGQSEGQKRINVSRRKSLIEDAPTYDDDGEITPEFVRRVRSHYGLDDAKGPADEGSSGDHQGDGDRNEGDAGAQTSGAATGATGTGESGQGGLEREGAEPEEGANEPRGDGDLDGGDDLTVQRSEEELRAGVREREAGKVNVKKRVRTERERIAVPKKREEVSVERVAVDREAQPGEMGEDEVSVTVIEEEVVVDKRAVVKEEIRVRKDVVEDEEVVEEDVRKEEIDIDDSSGTVGDR